MVDESGRPWRLDKTSQGYAIRFRAMASPCEVLLTTHDQTLAERLGEIAFAEAQRIEHKFSRYRTDNILCRINNSHGNPVDLDEETYQMLAFADRCFQLSDGLFDVTSGVLRRVWTFDGSDRLPGAADVRALLPLIGWEKVQLTRQWVCVPRGMELDLGGFGKEYAVDRTLLLLSQAARIPMLVNFGGDIACNGALFADSSWVVGIESLASQRALGNANDAEYCLRLHQGALATSGDSRRYLLRDGIRYSHILNPRTGFPISDAPHSVTVQAANCTDAGLLATLALLHGADAETFLEEHDVPHWILRGNNGS